ncbi:MAG TPA: DNA alkylation repair protein [Roseateles sp.]|uniref:DNA alkylation repair protein n=1 Tax=Roseateles sp. TaxID=1971397 RepID=UPI002ED7C771
MSTARKGAARTTDIPADVLQALSRGEIQSANLAECLALDQAELVRTVFPDLRTRALEEVSTACELGVLKRMAGIAAVLLDEMGEAAIERCRSHGADTVRGWACFMIGARPGLDLQARLAAIRPLADDAHFGVREWAWLAMRPHLAQDLETSIVLLAQWTTEPSERLRRYASEALRPRGVWCAHIAALKREPEQALPILSPLRADPSIYVQDSVANWLNDAAKDRPDWVRDLCALWLRTTAAASTHRISQRALRSLG